MKKGFRYYAAAWALLFVLFNLLVFVPPRFVGEYDKFGGAFFAGYVGITVAFVGQLVCAHFALKAENAQKLFYHLPLVTVSYTGLVLTLICGGLCMVVPDLPNWVGALACLLILIFCAVAVIKAAAAAELVAGVDEKVSTQTQFIKNLTVDAETLCARAQSDEAKAACKKVYEAIRYSDPMSTDALAGIEMKIEDSFSAFSTKIKLGESCTDLANELVNLIGDRNAKCKLFK
jgi:hypothetical protein